MSESVRSSPPDRTVVDVISAAMHPDEERRLAALHRLEVLDTESEERFDRLTELAGIVLGTPIALVSLVDRDRQWFKSHTGLDALQTDRDVAFCAHAILETTAGPFVVEDATTDVRFFDNPLVTGEPNVRFYAGQVLHDPTGFPVGTLCAIDRRPRALTDVQRAALEHIGHLVEQELARRTEIQLRIDLEASERVSQELSGRLRSAIESSSVGTALLDDRYRATFVNPAYATIMGLPAADLLGRTLDEFVLAAASPEPPSSTATPTVVRIELPSGDERWIRVHRTELAPIDGHVAHLAQIADITAHHRLLDALARSEEMARISLDALEQGVILIDSSGVILRCNPAAEQILGYSAATLGDLWRSDHSLTADEDGSELAASDRPVQRAIRTGQAVIGQMVTFRRGDGERIMLRMSCIPAAVESHAVVVTFTDVTAERRVQRLLDATLDTAPVGLAVLGRDRRILRCNPRFAAQAGRPILEVIGTDVLDLVAPDDQHTALDIADDLLHGVHTGRATEHRVARPDGEELWVSTHIAAIADPTQPFAIAATFDVTDERRMVQELSRFSFLFQHANDIISVIDAEGRLLYASPSSARILGYPAGYEHSEGILALVHPDDERAAAAHLLALVSDHAGTDPFGLRIRTLAGEWRHLDCIGVNLLHEPAVRGIVITARDTTEREELAAQLAHRAEHDTLTDLPNRRKLQQHLNDALQDRTHDRQPLSACFIDLDGFKAVNDGCGHAAGDALLVRVADAIRGAIRPTDTAARVGGDEFVVLLRPVADRVEAMAVAVRIRDAITALNDDSDIASRIGASVGVAISERGDVASSLLARADAALYRAKARHDSSIEMADGHEALDSNALHSEALDSEALAGRTGGTGR